jgi:peptide/nickel transport system ATP-binding protein
MTGPTPLGPTPLGPTPLGPTPLGPTSEAPPGAAPPPLVEARDVTVDFTSRSGPAARALDRVNLAVVPGEILALVGESGSGKTTLARTLMGLERPTAGTVHAQGRPLEYSVRSLRAFRRTAQMVLQDPSGSLNPRQTVYESVAEGIRLHRLTAADGDTPSEAELVAGALAQAGLRPPERLFLRYPHELSGGQRQRVLVAGALALRPRLLIADEPVSSLDASIRGEILGLLLRLRDTLGLAVVVVTHDLGLAWNIADRVAVMYLGRVVESGGTEEVLGRPRHPYTQALLSVVPELESLEPVVLRGEVPDPTRIPPGCRFHPRCPAVADGSAAAAGVLDDCRTTPLEVLPAHRGHRAACHLVEATARASDRG